MFRPLIAVLAAAGFAASAGAQYRNNLPLSPGVMPGSAIGPGTQFLPLQTPRFGPGRGFRGGVKPLPTFGPGWVVPGYFPFPSYGFGFGYGGYPFDGYGYGFPSPFDYGFSAPPIPIESVTRPAERNIVLANEFPATLSLQFPAAAEVWLNGTAVKGEASEERVLTSPVLKSGERFTFEVRAKWEHGGKKYESTRSVTLGPGDRSRLLVVSGTEVK